LLQQGLFVADICVLEPEDTIRFNPPASVQSDGSGERPGYNFDLCSPEVVLTRMKVDGGRLVLPDGMSYRVLLLPEAETMTPQLLRKIEQLIDAGATVIGPTVPQKSPGLYKYPQCDEELRQLANKLWNSGKIVIDKTAAEVLAGQGVPPDFGSDDSRHGEAAAGGEENVRFIHRTIGSSDVYFVANKKNQVEEALCSFRVQGKRPELWNPETGQIQRVAVYDEAGGRLRMPIRFEPYGSTFVVFRAGSAAEPRRITSVACEGTIVLDTAAPAATPQPLTTVLRNDKGDVQLETWQAGVYTLRTADGQTKRMEIPPLPPQEITGPWQVLFDPKRSGPAMPVSFESLTDWAQRPEAGIRYYSGTATYRKDFHLAEEIDLHDRQSKLLLDLGRVAVIAEVKLNGQNLGILWKPPFRLDGSPGPTPAEGNDHSPLGERSSERSPRVGNRTPHESNALPGQPATTGDRGSSARNVFWRPVQERG
jgi:hypothetical protein